jgi:hypothetical protein
MKRKHRRRKCLCCKKWFATDPRNHHHQRFCLKIKCRKASKAAKICAAKIKAKLRGDGDSKCFRVFDTIDKDILCRYQCLHPDSSNRGVGMVTARTRTGHDHVRDHGLSAVTVTDRSRMWTYHGAAADGHRTGHGLTTDAVADWSWTGHGHGHRGGQWRGFFRPNRDHFAEIRTLRMQGVRRPLLNPHKIVRALQPHR